MKNVLFSVVLAAAAWLVAGCGGTEFTEGFPPGDQDAGQDTGQEASIPDAPPEVETGDAVPDTQPETDVPDTQPDVEGDVSLEAGEDAEPDAVPDVLPEADEDVEQDVAPDVPLDVAPEAQSEAGPDGPQPIDCELHGVPGKIKVIVRHAVDAPKVLAVAGKLTHDDVALDSSFQTWCWAGANQEELVCVPRDKNGQPAQPVTGVGLRVQFVPGQVLDGVQMNDTSMFCNATGCPSEGDYLVCNGKETLCRWDNGVLSGPTDMAIGPWGMQNLVCVFP